MGFDFSKIKNMDLDELSKVADEIGESSKKILKSSSTLAIAILIAMSSVPGYAATSDASYNAVSSTQYSQMVQQNSTFDNSDIQSSKTELQMDKLLQENSELSDMLMEIAFTLQSNGESMDKIINDLQNLNENELSEKYDLSLNDFKLFKDTLNKHGKTFAKIYETVKQKTNNKVTENEISDMLLASVSLDKEWNSLDHVSDSVEANAMLDKYVNSIISQMDGNSSSNYTIKINRAGTQRL